MSASGVTHQGSGWNADDGVLSRASGLELSLPVLTAFGSPVVVTGQGRQAADVLLGPDDHVTAPPTVASVRPSPWNVGLSSEAHGAASAVASQAVDRDAVEEHTERSREEELP